MMLTNPKNYRVALLSLAVGGFGLGLTEFVIMGLLREVAQTTGVTIAQAGHYISAYALGVVVGAPVLTALANKIKARTALIWLMGCFAVFNTLSAAAGSYAWLFLARFLAGLPHGAFFGIGAVVAKNLAPPGQSARAAATMFAGLTFANVLGVPVGTLIGQKVGWQWTFVLIGVVGVLAMAAIYLLLPDVETDSELNWSVLRRGSIWAVLALTIIGTGGFFAWYSYIAPLVTEVSGLSDQWVTVATVLAGVGMTAGNVLGAKLADRYSPLAAASALLLLLSAALFTFSRIAVHPVATLAFILLIGALSFSIVAPIQLAMIQAAEGAETMGSAINQSAFNMGNALGAYLGGLPVAMGLGVASANWVGSGLACLGSLIAAALVLTAARKPTIPCSC
ncbi:MAG: MFS transporter [Candidatus Eremiobacteraeota bacterium]|nr:MFS transporter [Candidatus Eremiobacteraeota bacterium]